ncbi:hypothetical protein SAMN05518845_102429 [Variovorax sp. YR750]|uniref:DUF1269 domain-containing protein n=1 Tax=Variovorax sp. YR750 TaxID=1884384 RepID=UPI0008B755FA|nr:DUF1269 domain-containing protein [Variovorax sp. YR750]SEK69797.1 hypothetical protein SAMN05518845_102429 [Variovorax sp. YR750]
MKRRIYWLMPDLASARSVMHDLVRARVDIARIHFTGPEGMDMTGLHAANVWQTSDLVHAAKTGLVVGSACGAVFGLVAALLFPIVGDDPEWEVAVLLAILGGVVGAWSASMIGISIPSPRLRRFESAIAQGRILLMVDLPRSRVRDIEALLQSAHPEARFEGEEPQVPALRSSA